MEASASSDKPDLSPDALAPDPSDPPPHTVSMHGILGESAIASSVRLYLDRELTTYYDISVEDIVAREKVPAEQSPLGVDATLLTVRKDIRLAVHRAATRSLEAEFLAGDFTAPGSFTPAPAAPAAVPVHQPPTNYCTGGTCHFAADRPPTETYCTGGWCHYAVAGAGYSLYPYCRDVAGAPVVAGFSMPCLDARIGITSACTTASCQLTPHYNCGGPLPGP